LLRRNPQHNCSPVVVLQRVLVDIQDVDAQTDLCSQVDDSVTTAGRRSKSIMIENVVSGIQCPVESTDLVSGCHELIMNRATDEAGASGEQDLHVE
jgi:hypothetical protein